MPHDYILLVSLAVESVEVSWGEGAVLLGRAMLVAMPAVCIRVVDGAVLVHGRLLLHRSGALSRGRSR